MDQLIDGFIQTYDPETPIIAYCSGPACDDSHVLAEFLMDFGYENIQVFVGGMPAWQSEGYPIE